MLNDQVAGIDDWDLWVRIAEIYLRCGDLRQPLWNLGQLPRLHRLTLALIVNDRTQRISTRNRSRLQVGAQANRRLQKLS